MDGGFFVCSEIGDSDFSEMGEDTAVRMLLRGVFGFTVPSVPSVVPLLWKSVRR